MTPALLGLISRSPIAQISRIAHHPLRRHPHQPPPLRAWSRPAPQPRPRWRRSARAPGTGGPRTETHLAQRSDPEREVEEGVRRERALAREARGGGTRAPSSSPRLAPPRRIGDCFCCRKGVLVLGSVASWSWVLRGLFQSCLLICFASRARRTFHKSQRTNARLLQSILH
uniref:Uncharacterized protein n=1 Tax=Arundo donax TaxID=35708 RepID=A0A0A9EXH3_ARUDO